MKTSLRRMFSLGVVLLFITHHSSIAQTITSTTAGGDWEAASTWIGGVIPSAGSDVVIAGPVNVATGSGYSCRNLTVNSAGSLFERTGYYYYVQTLTINGNVINNGAVRNAGSMGLLLRVKGNITNNATWTILKIELNGTGTQTLTAASGKKFECAVAVDTTARPVVAAGSDLAFTGGFDLGKSTLDMKSFAVSLNGAGANIYNGNVVNSKDISGAPVKDQYGTPAYPILDNITYDGSPNIKGRFLINSNVTLKGSVTVSDTVEEKTGYYDYEKTLWIKGSLVNNGVIRSVGRGIALNVTGNITNNGKWTFNRTELSGSVDQTLVLSTGKLFESSFKSMDSLGVIIAASNLAFTAGVDLGKSTLDMKSFAISLNGAGANIYNGYVINAKDITGAPLKDQYGTPAYPILDNISYDGSPNIKGRFLINANVTLKGSVTVTDTVEEKTGYYDYEKTLFIKGNLVNNGIMRNVGSRGLILNSTGNLTNNGKWQFTRTELSGNTDQTLTLGTGKQFESSFNVTDSTRGMIVAGSGLAFTQGFNLGKATLDMKSFAVSLNGASSNIYNGNVINAKDITGSPLKDIYGTPAYPVLDNITYDGNPTIRGRFLINTNVTMKGGVTVSDTVEEKTGYYDYEKTLSIKGNLVNNGIMRNVGSRGLVLNITGNLTNNGKWQFTRTELSGTSDQTLTLAPNKLFEGAFKVTDSLGMIIAGSNLATTSWFDLHKCVLDMKNLSLTLKGEGATVYNGFVINTKDLIGVAAPNIYGTPVYPVLDNITYDGNPNLKGRFLVNSTVTLKGEITVSDTLEEKTGYYDYEKTLWIKGNLVNNGNVRNVGGRGLVMDVTGNITALKPFANVRNQLAGDGNRTVVDKLSQITYLSTGEKVGLYGDNYLPNLSIDAKSKCQLASGGNLYVGNSAIDERLDNWSVISYTRKLSSSQTNTFFKARVTVIPNSGIDSLKVSSYGHQVPARFANAVRTWYRLDRTPKTATSNVTSLTMYYSDEELGQNIEANLQVYYSADSGKSWRQLSTTQNLTRNVAQNYVTIADVPSIGDYLLSSSPDPVSVRPSVMVSLMGRTQIRVGPPNQYTVQYVNNSDVETGDMLLELRGTGGVHIRSVTPSPQPGYKSTTLPIDSLTYDGDDTSVLLWVTSMAPREERTFSLIATATPGLGKTSSSAELITLTTVVVYIGVGLITDYVTDAIVNGTEAAYATKVPKGEMSKATKQALNETYQKTKIGKEWREEPVKKVTGEVAEKLTEKFFGVVLWPLKLGKVLLVDCVGGAIRGAKRYVGGDAVEQAEVFMEEGAKPLQKVTSWDPNEKIAPDGYGTQRFLSTIGRMNYQILFENKKEATAPAYTIVVVDTLQADFDSTSVVFEKTSHDGPAYNWQMTRNGNILKWRIDAIELPPNVNPPEGEGYVTFSVKPKSGTASGTVLKNTATITFDLNAPIRTNQVLNTLDFTPPTTVMKPIPAKLTSGTIVVKWQATDGTGGSGVASTTVFASKDGGPYISVGTSSSDSLVFTPSSGSHKYTFYALAKDNVGNVESVRPALVTSDIVNEVEEKVPVPTEFSLSQNYPNPFNPTTQIVFSLSATVRATLKVYDMLGREIVTLIDEEKNPGRYTVKWDASKVASGVYFYRLIAGDFVQTRRLTLIK